MTRRLAALLLIVATCAVYAQDLAWTVDKLRLDGKEVPSLSDISRRDRSGDNLARVALKTGERLPMGAEIAVPQRVSIELVDANGNRTTFYPGSRMVLLHLSARGSRLQLIEGRVRFSVMKALDYFNVETAVDRFIATVKGTVYELSLQPSKTIEFTVDEGVVEVERFGTVRIAKDATGQPREAQNVAEVVQLRAGQTRRYDLTQAQYLQEFGNFREAEAYFRKALEVAEKGGDLQRIQRARENLGWILITLSANSEAAALFQRNFEAAVRSRLELEQVVASVGLGDSYIGLGEHRIAIGHYERAFAILKRLFGDRDNYGTFAVYVGLGRAHYGLKEYRRAVEFFERARETSNRLYWGPKNYSYFVLVNTNLGLALAALNDHSSAMAYFIYAMGAHKDQFGEGDHVVIASLYNNMAAGWVARNEFPFAIDFFERALAMYQRLFGARDHDSIVGTLLGLAIAFEGLGDKAMASKYREEANAMAARIKEREKR